MEAIELKLQELWASNVNRTQVWKRLEESFARLPAGDIIRESASLNAGNLVDTEDARVFYPDAFLYDVFLPRVHSQGA